MTGAKARLLTELSRRRKELIELCAALVRIPSENPPGDTSRIAAFVVRYLRERGMRSAVHEPRKGMPNVVAGLGRGAPNLVLSGHLDEFPAGAGWSFPPFSGRVRGGRILGRGAGDMRGGLAVALFLMGLIRAAGLELRGTLTLAFASDEETGGAWGTQWLLKHVKAVRGDACLIGESSGSVPVVRPGYTDGRFFRRAGIPTVVYGPRVRGMGGPDESIDTRELIDVATVHLGVVLDYLGVDSR